MSYWKKALSIGLAAVMTASMLAGCGGSGGAAKETAASGGDTAGTQAAADNTASEDIPTYTIATVRWTDAWPTDFLESGFMKELEEKQESSKDMLEAVKKALEGKVGNVKLSGRLKSHPVCLSSEGELSMEMAKTLNAMPGTEGQKLQAQTVLEINPEHPIYQRLMELQTGDSAKLDDYAKLLYDQALLIAGMPVEDPVAFSNAVCKLMTK